MVRTGSDVSGSVRKIKTQLRFFVSNCDVTVKILSTFEISCVFVVSTSVCLGLILSIQTVDLSVSDSFFMQTHSCAAAESSVPAL